MLGASPPGLRLAARLVRLRLSGVVMSAGGQATLGMAGCQHLPYENTGALHVPASKNCTGITHTHAHTSAP